MASHAELLLSAAGAFGPDTAQSTWADLADAALEAAAAGTAVLAAGAARVSEGSGRSDSGFAVSGLDTKISATDMVSDVDREAESAVVSVLRRRRPDDGVVGEEGTSREGSNGVRWVIDPLDGTTNFLFGIPQFCVSIAAEVDGQTVVGVVWDPSRGEVFAAVRDGGAFLNGRQRSVPAGRSTLETALVGTGFGYRAERRRWQAEVAARVIPSVRDIRRLGSAALDLSWTGAGRLDAYYEWGLNPWDLAAGALFAEEAGAVVEVMPNRLVVAAPPELFDPLVRLLDGAGALESRDGPEPVL